MSSKPQQELKKQRGCSPIMLIFAFIGFAILLLIGGFTWKHFVADSASNATSGALNQVGNFFSKVLGNEKKLSYSNESKTISIEKETELSLFTIKIHTEHELKNQEIYLHLFQNESVLRTKGVFKVKLGYKIPKGFTIDINKYGTAWVSNLPEPEVLSAEMIRNKIKEERQGWWNKISSKDREAMLAQLRYAAIREAKELGLLEQMEPTLKERLAEILGVLDVEIVPNEESARPFN